MNLLINIDDADFARFKNSSNELGADEFELLENLVKNCLAKSNLKCQIISSKKEETEEEKKFTYFENKIKEHKIFQSSVAKFLNTTQASISRSLKKRTINSNLGTEIVSNVDKLLISSYCYQFDFFYDFEQLFCKNKIKEEAKEFVRCLGGLVEFKLDYTFNFKKFEENICDFITHPVFYDLDFNKLYEEVDLFIEAANEIVDSFLLPKRNN